MTSDLRAGRLDHRHLTAWRDDLRRAVDRAIDGFEARYGYPPGDNVVDHPDPVGGAPLAAQGPSVPRDLLLLYATVGAVSLPDIGNGFFLHGAGRVAEEHRSGELRQVSGRHHDEVVAFASDGGGTRYALGRTGSPVYRLPPGRLLDGRYESDDRRFDIVAADLAGFLRGMLTAVETFAATGTPTYL